MSRIAVLLLTFVLLAPLAAASGAVASTVTETPLQKAADLASSAGSTAASAGATAASATGSALGAAASAIGEGLAAAARATGAALAAIGEGIAAVATTIGASFLLIGRAFFGFVSQHPKETAVATATTASAGGLWFVLRKYGALLFLPLYTRLAPSQMLDNAARNRVYEHVRTNPGAHPSGIAETLDLGWGTVVYHLSRLEDSKLVVARPSHHRKCYFAVGSELDANARTAVAAMAHDKAKLIVHAVRAQPGISQKEVAEKVGMSQALASWHVKRLVESGVLLTVREGRTNQLRVAEHVPHDAAPVHVAVA